jgi:hypothetical protein
VMLSRADSKDGDFGDSDLIRLSIITVDNSFHHTIE